MEASKLFHPSRDAFYYMAILHLALLFPSNAFIMMNLHFSTLLILFLGLANALITFEDIDTLAVITTSCFKTISWHDSFQAPLLNFQHVIPREENGQNLEIVSSSICRRRAVSKGPKITANALSELNSNLTAILDVPMDATEKVGELT